MDLCSSGYTNDPLNKKNTTTTKTTVFPDAMGPHYATMIFSYMTDREYSRE